VIYEQRLIAYFCGAEVCCCALSCVFLGFVDTCRTLVLGVVLCCFVLCFAVLLVLVASVLVEVLRHGL
jgi:hypothetical protein